ncbi:MAG TPA: sulfurtransferase complex subunit TusB [Pseudothermotoga sp.]
MALILIKFGTNNPAEKIKLESASLDDDVVLIQNGIYWALNDMKQYTKAKVYAIKEDFLARGYEESNSKVPLINYAQLIELIEKHPKSIS